MTTQLMESEVELAERYAAALDEVPLEQLAADIKREHEAAEYNMRDSLKHARSAGVKLLEVKRRLAYGEFMPWVDTHCEFSHSTANLYMKIAKRWDTLGDSQPVTNLTLRQASQLLYMDPSDEDAEATAELVNLKLLDWPDLDGLEPLEVRALAKEVRSYYEDLCFEPDEALAAKRAALPDEWNPVVTINRNAIRTCACRVASELRDGKSGKGKVRQRLRSLEMTVLEAAVKDTTPTGEQPAETKPPGARVAVLRHVSPFEAYAERTQRFIAETHALLTEPHGLLNERVTLSDWQRQRLVKLITDVRQALDELEEQAGQDDANRVEVAEIAPMLLA